jgi:hypothetical protein
MCRPICRRVVALAVAYAVALNLVLPLLAAFASPADAVIVADLCTTNRSGSPADLPGKPRPICPLACSAPDCGINGLFVGGSGSATALVARAPRPLFFIGLDDQTLLPRDIGAQFARAPPRV